MRFHRKFCYFQWIVHLLISIIGVMILAIVGFYVAEQDSSNKSQWKFLTKNRDLIKDLDKRIVRLETFGKMEEK